MRRSWLVALVILAVIWFIMGLVHPMKRHPVTPTTSTPSLAAPTTTATIAALPALSTAPTTEPSRAQIDAGQSPTGQQEAAQRAILASRPAFQHLPWTGAGIQVAVLGYATDGRAILAVSSSYGLARARAAYAGFLATYHDSGRGYVPQFYVGLGRPGSGA